MVLIIDNYDGCAYNLYQSVGNTTDDVKVIHNDQITIDDIKAMEPTHIILSGGGNDLDHVGIAMDVVREFQGKIPILGVCLGFRMICGVYGSEMCPTNGVMQGIISEIELDPSCPLFKGIPEKIKGMRYHSQTIVRKDISDELKIIATADDGDVMGVSRDQYKLYGLQFHPESYFTEYGDEIISNFLSVST